MIPAYEFYPAHRRCPACRGPLVTTTPLIRKFLQGPLHGMGITCFCVQCSSRYRAVSWLRFGWVSWLGPIGRWIWWKTVSLDLTLRSEESRL